jgi:hypothetical protein
MLVLYYQPLVSSESEIGIGSEATMILITTQKIINGITVTLSSFPVFIVSFISY